MEFKNVIKLSNGKKYIISNQVEIDKKQYYQLIPIEEENFLIAEKNDAELRIIQDEQELSNIIVKMASNLLKSKK